MPGKKRAISHVVDLTTEQIQAASQTVIDRRTSARTKENYANKIKLMLDWYVIKYPNEVDDNGELILPLSDESVIAFFTSKCFYANQRIGLSGPQDLTTDELKNNEPYAPEYLSGFRSALVDLYRRKTGAKFSNLLDDKLKAMLEGYEGICNDLKKKSLMALNPGKRELRRDGYVLICKKLMKFDPNLPRTNKKKKKTKDGDNDEEAAVNNPSSSNDSKTKGTRKNGSWSTSIFGWCFFTLLWNLISRPESVENITLNMITWKDDCLAIDEHVSSIFTFNSY